MTFLPRDGLHFSGLTWAFKLLQITHTHTSIWHTRPLTSTF